MKNYSISFEYVDEADVVALHRKYFGEKEPLYSFYTTTVDSKHVFFKNGSRYTTRNVKYFFIVKVDLDDEEVTYLNLAMDGIEEFVPTEQSSHNTKYFWTFNEFEMFK